MLKHFLVVALLLTSVSSYAGRTIFHNGKVFTANSSNPWAEGVVVQDKFVIAVGSSQFVLLFQNPGATVVDLQGKTLIPGFNDAHVHPTDTVSFPRAVHVNIPDFIPGPGPTFAQIKALLAQAAANNPPGTWLFATIGTAVVDDPTANRFNMDDVTPDHPVLLGAWYGHGTFLNTKAMQTIGIGETEPDPFGGFYERLPNSNVLTGICHEYAEHRIRRYFAGQMTDAELKALYENFAQGAIAKGYTTLQEFSVGLTQDRHLNILDQANLPLRWRAMCFPLTLNESCTVPAKFLPYNPFNKLVSSGIKWIVDGTPIERLAFLSQDYADKPGYRGTLNFPAPDVQSAVNRSTSGLTVVNQGLMHAVGDATAQTILDKMTATGSDGFWKTRRFRIEHGYLVRPSMFTNVKNKGIYVINNPLHNSLQPVFQARYPTALYDDTMMVKSLLNNGIKVAMGSDSVTVPGDPFLDIFFATFQPVHPAEALSVEEAVTAYTRTSAEAEFQEALKGTLAPGKLADLVILSKDIFTVAPPDILSTQVLMTMVDGEVVYGSLTTK